MTWVFDQIQTFLGHIRTVKDHPELYATAIEYIEQLMGAVHDVDHALDHRIAKALDVTRAMKRIREFNKEAERRKRVEK